MLIMNDKAALQAAIAHHRPQLEREEARHSLILGLFARVPTLKADGVRLWSFKRPGSCALQTSEALNIVLGELDVADEEAIAASAASLKFAGIIGPDASAERLAGLLDAAGIRFEPPLNQAILALKSSPRHPNCDGHARLITADDAAAFGELLLAFHQEAIPHDPLPTAEQLARTAASGNYMGLMVNDTLVSIAGKVRDAGTVASIGGVYTFPGHRGHGYAGAVTAALCERLLAEGKRTICLFVDLSNPYSQRCYANIGFQLASRSMHVPRCE